MPLDQAARVDPLPRIGPRYLLAATAGLLFGLFGLCVILAALDATGHLPPPAIANSLCVDEKLRFLRDHAPTQAKVLVAGSSVAWRHTDGGVIAERLGMAPFNVGFCGLDVAQASGVIDWMMQRYRSVERVLLLIAPPDFARCTGRPAWNLAESDRYVFEDTPRWPFYLRYFDPISLARNATQVRDKRDNRTPLEPLRFTPYGDGPLDTDQSGALGFGPVYALDPRCFDALHTLADSLLRKQVELLVVISPIHPAWKTHYDPDAQVTQRFEREVATALSGTRALLWNSDAGAHFEASEFTDAVHLRWSAVQRYSRLLAERLAPRRAER